MGNAISVIATECSKDIDFVRLSMYQTFLSTYTQHTYQTPIYSLIYSKFTYNILQSGIYMQHLGHMHPRHMAAIRTYIKPSCRNQTLIYSLIYRKSTYTKYYSHAFVSSILWTCAHTIALIYSIVRLRHVGYLYCTNYTNK